MKNSSTTLRRERVLFNAFLLLEQVLGPRGFAFFQKAKNRLLIRQLERLKTTKPPEKQNVLRVDNIDAETFNRDFFDESKPVIFSGQAASWPCVKKWNLDYFQMGYGQKDVLLVNAQGLTSRQNNSDYEFLTIKDLIENIKQGGDKYLRFSPLLENNPQLVEDLDMKWLGMMKGLKTFASTYYMFIGGKGKKTLLHTDQPCNLYVQVYGEKRWTLYSPEDSSLIYPVIANTAYVKSPVDVDHPDDEKYPLFKYATAFEAHLRPGDILYVPPHIWHFVENLDDTIAVGYRFSSLKAAVKSSLTFSLLRIFSTNPPIWKTMSYGKIDTNLIWAHAGGKIKDLLKERELRKNEKS